MAEKNQGGAAVAEPPKPRPSLFKLQQDQQALYDLLTERGGDITGNEETVDGWMTEITIAVDSKLDDYAQVIRKLELDASVARAEQARYQSLAQTRENAAESLKKRIKELLEKAGRKSRETQHHKFSVAGNGGKQPIDIVIAELPDDYVDYVAVANEDKIRATIVEDEKYIDEESGEEKTRKKSVKGVTVKERGTHLRMK